MPSVLPTIPNDPPQGIQALLDKVYLWNPDVSNELIEKVNALLTKLGDAIGAIRPYNEMVAPINQYEPCYYGDGVYVAKNYLAERAEEFNEEDWILIARKEITADEIRINFADQEDTVQGAIDTLKTDQDELGDQVSAIEEKIPESASSTNQLVTKNEVLALPTFTYMVVNELPETGEEKIIYLVPKAGEGNDVHDEYIWVNGGYELIGTTAVDLSGYLPTTGGSLTGKVLVSAENPFIFGTDTYGGIIIESGFVPTLMTDRNQSGLYLGSVYNGGWNYGCIVTNSGVFPAGPNSRSLGQHNYRWEKVCALSGEFYRLRPTEDITKEILLPNKTGTMALVEDITNLSNDSITTKDLTVGTDEGTLNIGITAGVATIATNNGLDIVSQTKFDTAPTTDDSTAWADVNATALVTKAQVTTALSTAGGGDVLPDQTGNAGKFLTTDGTTASWGGGKIATNETIVGFNASAWTASVVVGAYAQATGAGGTSVGHRTQANDLATAIGCNAQATAKNAIQLGAAANFVSNHTNSDANTFKVGNANGNFEMMSADGTIPTDRYTTTPTTAGTYVPKLTIAGDGTATREWGPESGGAGGDYLPLSGGTMTGSLSFSALNKTYELQPTSYGNFRFLIDGVLTLDIEEGTGLLPARSNYFSLGRGARIWKNVYTAKLSNGADLIVPTEGGTLARIEDIDERIGDISTALTAILGE